MEHISKQELGELIKQAQAGDFPPKLYKVLQEMTKALKGDDDILSRATIQLLKHLHKMDPEKNVFSYISDIIISQIRNTKRDARNELKKNYGYAFHVQKWRPRWQNGRHAQWRFTPQS